jgi:agmatinase
MIPMPPPLPGRTSGRRPGRPAAAQERALEEPLKENPGTASRPSAEPQPYAVEFNYGGLDLATSCLSGAHAVVLPVPYDGTTSYRPGTRFGPHALLVASRNMELYDEVLGALYPFGIHTLPELEPVADPEAMVARVEEAADWVLDQGKMLITLGGEHSLTTGPVRAHARRHPGLSVLQLDAHGDLRPEYHGTRFSHACVMSRVRELVPAIQAGIRSVSEEEAERITRERLPVFSARRVKAMAGDFSPIVEALSADVYLTVDLDVFDPGQCPGVGTPEPGGLDWFEVTELVAQVARRRRLVGFDIMELMPLAGDTRSEFLASRLLYRIWGWCLVSQGKHPGPAPNRPLL